MRPRCLGGNAGSMTHPSTASPARRRFPPESVFPPPARGWLLLPVIFSATFMTSFDYMVVNVAAPSLARDLHAGPAALELSIAGYAFTYASGMVTGGRLGDLFGHRRLFLLGLAGFTVASLLCGLAGSPDELVAARLLQGLAAAAVVPQVLALVTAIIPAPERPRALSWFGVVIGLGGISGQLIGGLLLGADLLGLGWRVIFLVNVPVGAAGICLAFRMLPRGQQGPRPRLDPLGAAGISASLALALVPLTLGKQQGWPAWAWVSIAAAAPAMALALAWERRLAAQGGQPLLDLALFRDRSFAIGLAINVAFMLTFGSFMFVLTLMLQDGLHDSPLHAGLMFLPMGALSMATSLAGRRLVARYGLRVLTAGGTVTAVGILMQALGQPVLLAVCLVGAGSGLVLPALIGVVLAGVRPGNAGAASGVLTTAQQFAGATGVAVVGAVFFGALATRGYVGAAHVAAWLDLGFVTVMTILTTALIRRSSPAS
jgi:MFS family permease